MRDILFRGKSVNDGNWVQGSLVITTIEPADDTPIKHYHIEDMTIGVFPDAYQSGLSETVDPNTVGQFTGLTDNNGKKIFEGDILYVHDRLLKCTAPFHEFRGVVEHKNGKFVIVGDLMTHYRWIDYDITVLGNIHDNPELLEATP